MLKEKFMKMLAKKRDLPAHEKNAKMDVVKGLQDDMSDHMQQRMGKLKKVTVASDSDEGLKAGLDKAKDIAASSPMYKGGEVDQGYTEAGHDLMDEPEEEGEKYMDANPHQDQGAIPEEEEVEGDNGDESENEFEGLDMAEVSDKLQKLMDLKKKLESKKK